MREVDVPNGERGLFSEALGIYLWLKDAVLKLYDPASGTDLPTPEEEGAARAVAEAQVETAKAQVETAKAQVETAKAQVETAKARADTAEARADTAEARALAQQRLILVRLAESRFDAATAAALAPLLERAGSWEDLARIGEWLVAPGTSAELLARVRALLS